MEAAKKAQTFAICIYIMGLLSSIALLIDLLLLREFLQDQLLEQVIERLTRFSQLIEPINEENPHEQNPAPKTPVQQYVIDYLLQSAQ